MSHLSLIGWRAESLLGPHRKLWKKDAVSRVRIFIRSQFSVKNGHEVQISSIIKVWIFNIVCLFLILHIYFNRSRFLFLKKKLTKKSSWNFITVISTEQFLRVFLVIHLSFLISLWHQCMLPKTVASLDWVHRSV